MRYNQDGLRRAVVWIVLIALGLLLNGCGETAQPLSGPAQTPRIREIEIHGNDSMKFDVTTIVAAPGETLRIVLINAGSQPREAAGHNWILLKRHVNVTEFANAAVLAKETNYVPVSEELNIIAKTKLLGPGERDAITVTVPKESGKYIYLCSFPAHCQLGMRGVLIVQ